MRNLNLKTIIESDIPFQRDRFLFYEESVIELLGNYSNFTADQLPWIRQLSDRIPRPQAPGEPPLQDQRPVRKCSSRRLHNSTGSGSSHQILDNLSEIVLICVTLKWTALTLLSHY